MYGFFKFSLTGTCTSDAEFSKLRNGQDRCTINIAVNRPFKKEDGGWDQTTTYVRLALFGKACQRKELRLVKKGVNITAEGDVSSYVMEQGDGKKLTGYNFKPSTLAVGGRREKLDPGAGSMPSDDDDGPPPDDYPEGLA